MKSTRKLPQWSPLPSGGSSGGSRRRRRWVQRSFLPRRSPWIPCTRPQHSLLRPRRDSSGTLHISHSEQSAMNSPRFSRAPPTFLPPLGASSWSCLLWSSFQCFKRGWKIKERGREKEENYLEKSSLLFDELCLSSPS